MPDLQMCTAIYQDDETGKTIECGVRFNCYRHTAKPSMMQAWGQPDPDFQELDGCDNYWPNGRMR